MSIFCLQETHGNWALLNKHFRLLLEDYWAFASFGPHNAGGVVVFVSKSVAPSFDCVSTQELVIGRVLRVELRGTLPQFWSQQLKVVCAR